MMETTDLDPLSVLLSSVSASGKIGFSVDEAPESSFFVNLYFVNAWPDEASFWIKLIASPETLRLSESRAQ